MSILRDIMDIYKEVSEEGGLPYGRMKFNQRSSIAKESQKGILQFPVLVSSSISLEELTMVSKALERQYVSFVRVLTSIDSITDEKSIEQYLKRIHQNFSRNDMGTMVSGLRESSDSYLTIRNKVYSPELEKLFCETEQVFSTLIDNLEDTENCEIVNPRDLSYTEREQVAEKLAMNPSNSNSEFSIPVSCNNSIVCDHGDNSYSSAFVMRNSNNSLEVLESCKFDKDVKQRGENLLRSESSLIALNKLVSKEYVSDFNEDVLNEKVSATKLNIGSSDNQLFNKYNRYGKNILNEDYVEDLDHKTENSNYAARNIMDKNLTDNDVKKSNELAPTILHLKTYFKDSKGILQATDYLVGVKTMSHVVPSQSVIDNLSRGVKRNRSFFNFVKWTSGEISFFKDFVLTVDDIKDDIKGKFEDTQWWNMLRRRRKYSKMLKAINLKNQLVPNTTLVVTMEEVNTLKNNYGIDIMNPKIANTLSSEYFLLGIVILDQSVESGYFYFDGQLNYSQYSYVSLERENSNQAREVKNIMQVMGKM